MSNVILYGNRSQKYAAKKPKKKHRLRTFLLTLLTVLCFFEGVYFYLCYTSNGFISKWRSIYIQTALSTMNHQWLATELLPEKIVQDTVAMIAAGREEQIGTNSSWNIPSLDKENETDKPDPSGDDTPQVDESVSVWIREDPEGAEAFFTLFHELNQEEFLAYLDAHPSVMDNGWANINIDEAGLDQDGLDLYTTNGDQVLAINVPDQILLVRLKGSSWRGVLAIAKDPAQLSMRWSAGIGSYGQTVKDICERSGAILGVSGSGFIDPNGTGNGGILSGYAMCDGEARGTPSTSYGYKRLELHEDNRLYITDTFNAVSSSVTDAAEFTPALIVDGKIVINEYTDWNGNNPRTIVGQTIHGEILMLVVEGRIPSVSLGVSVYTCAERLYEYDCAQAMNLDGGSSSIMYYNGRSITICSNTALANGRTLPNAWVYFPGASDS